MNKQVSIKWVLFSFLTAVALMLLVIVLFFRDTLVYKSYYEVITNVYDGEIIDSEMQESILSGITSGLGDEYSMYFPKLSGDNFIDSLSTNHVGIGIKYDSSQNIMQVSEIIDNSPASKIDLYPGDIINSINGTEINEDNITNPSALFYEDEISEIEVLRPSTNEVLNLEVQAGNFETQSIYYQILENTDDKVVGYIQIESFSDNTAEQFKIALDELEKQNIDQLIIDVRNNGGGSLDTVEDIIELIVYSEAPYLYTKKGDEVIEEYYSSLDSKKNYDLTLIQNNNSASASEILAGAIQQAAGGKIVGQQSYGKGSVQTYYNLGGDLGAVKITTAHWYTPNDESISGIGITPDIEVEKNFFDYIDLSPIVLDDNLDVGSSGVDVIKLNNFLSILGYEDGYNKLTFDQETKVAVENFQSDNNLNKTSIVDYQTAYLLYQKAYIGSHNINVDPYIKAAIKE